MAEAGSFKEATPRGRPIRDLGLQIAGTQLEPIVAELFAELEAVGITRVRPRVYLSSEWGVPSDTIALAVPFYLARPELTRLHAEKTGHVEGHSPADILRYLRHEMGHVMNNAYRLYREAEWIARFGDFTKPYAEDYTPQPFSHRFVRHLPGWYAQKHPEEDWAETFAVWMTPGLGWRSEYAQWTEALAKLVYCDERMRALRDEDPMTTDDKLDEDVGGLDSSLDEFYGELEDSPPDFPPDLAGALGSIFDSGVAPSSDAEPRLDAAALLVRMEAELLGDVYRWTGHFPERTRALVRHLKGRSEEHGLSYGRDHEMQAVIGVTTLVTALAMNFILHGSYHVE